MDKKIIFTISICYFLIPNLSFGINLKYRKCSKPLKERILKSLKKIQVVEKNSVKSSVRQIKRDVALCPDSTNLMEKANKDIRKSLEKRMKIKLGIIKYNSKFRDVRQDIEDFIVEEKKYYEEYQIKKNKKNLIKLRKKLSVGLENQLKRQKTCTPVDLKNDLTKKVYNQNDVGWCYAFSAADLISQHTGKDVSRVHLSLLYNKYNILEGPQKLKTESISLVDGGEQFSALKIAKDKGVCLESGLPSDFRGLTSDKAGKQSDAGVSYQDKQEQLEKSLAKEKKLYKLVVKGFKRGATEEETKAAYDALEVILNDRKTSENDSYGFYNEVTYVEGLYRDYHGTTKVRELLFLENLKKVPLLPKGVRKKIESRIDDLSLDSTAMLSKIKEENFCRNGNGEYIGQGTLGKIFPDMTFTDFVNALTNSSRKDFFLKLQDLSCKERLDLDYKIRSKLPLGSPAAAKELDYLLEKGKLASVSYDADIFDGDLLRGGIPAANHVSTVIARRWNEENNQCEFQIKNSWGEKWGPNGDGFIWVPEETLSRATVMISSIKD